MRRPSTCSLPYFGPDVVLHQADALPHGGIWRGQAGSERFFLVMSRVWDAFDLVEQEFPATGETCVVRTLVHARARVTRRAYRGGVDEGLTE